jgi:hypothetical protein
MIEDLGFELEPVNDKEVEHGREVRAGA